MMRSAMRSTSEWWQGDLSWTQRTRAVYSQGVKQRRVEGVSLSLLVSSVSARATTTYQQGQALGQGQADGVLRLSDRQRLMVVAEPSIMFIRKPPQTGVNCLVMTLMISWLAIPPIKAAAG